MNKKKVCSRKLARNTFEKTWNSQLGWKYTARETFLGLFPHFNPSCYHGGPLRALSANCKPFLLCAHSVAHTVKIQAAAWSSRDYVRKNIYSMNSAWELETSTKFRSYIVHGKMSLPFNIKCCSIVLLRKYRLLLQHRTHRNKTMNAE